MASAVANKPKFSVMLQTDTYKNLINNTLQDPKQARRFVASISSAVATNPALQACDSGTIISCALLGESLNLSPSPQLGEYYLVPFEDRKNNRTVATFILGYKGIKQLAMNTGLYKQINVQAVKKGELIKYDPFENIFIAKPIEDPLKREVAETTGYYAYYELLNGYRECLYWSKEKMMRHADRYSSAFSIGPTKGKKPEYNKVSFADYEAGKVSKDKEWLYSSFWYKDFDGMAKKTMYRQLLSTAPKSIEMRQAFETDESLVNLDGTPEYVDTFDDNPSIEDFNEPRGDTAVEEEGVTDDSFEAEEISLDSL